MNNPSQSLNVVISVIAGVAVALTVGTSMNAVLGVFGAWAVLAGFFQLITAFAAGGPMAPNGHDPGWRSVRVSWRRFH